MTKAKVSIVFWETKPAVYWAGEQHRSRSVAVEVQFR